MESRKIPEASADKMDNIASISSIKIAELHRELIDALQPFLVPYDDFQRLHIDKAIQPIIEKIYILGARDGAEVAKLAIRDAARENHTINNTNNQEANGENNPPNKNTENPLNKYFLR